MCLQAAQNGVPTVTVSRPDLAAMFPTCKSFVDIRQAFEDAGFFFVMRDNDTVLISWSIRPQKPEPLPPRPLMVEYYSPHAMERSYNAYAFVDGLNRHARVEMCRHATKRLAAKQDDETS